MDIRLEQLNILMNEIRTVITNKNCPEWVVKRLGEGVKKAKSLKETDEPTEQEYEPDYTYRPFVIGEHVLSNVDDGGCLYEIIEQSDPIDNINLFTLRIIKGNKNNPTTTLIHNVPETMIVHIKDK